MEQTELFALISRDRNMGNIVTANERKAVIAHGEHFNNQHITDIDLWMKEEYGMPFDSTFYEHSIHMLESSIDRIFGVDMIKIGEYSSFGPRGYFKLTYEYVPFGYTIVIDNEFTVFDIQICDKDNASNSLYNICKQKSNLDRESIHETISVLKTVLEKDEINLYFDKDGKLYRKNKEGIKRIKDIREMLNG